MFHMVAYGSASSVAQEDCGPSSRIPFFSTIDIVFEANQSSLKQNLLIAQFDEPVKDSLL